MSILKPFRPVGSVCGDIPSALTSFNAIPFLVVPLGFTFAVYKGLELRAIRSGPTFEHKITAVAASGKYRVIAEGGMIHCLSHHKILWSAPHNGVLKSQVSHLAIRDNIVFSVGDDRAVATWSLKRGHRIFTFLIASSNTSGRSGAKSSKKNNNNDDADGTAGTSAAVTCLTIPVEYRNKILIGLADGSIHLYNFSRPANISNEEGASGIPSELAPLFVKKLTDDSSSSISAIQTSQIKDIIAVATSTGRVMVYDFAADDIIAEFRHSANMDPTRVNSMLLQAQKTRKQQQQQQSNKTTTSLDPTSAFLMASNGSFVTALTFRRETPNSNAMLISAAADGSVAVWDLEKQNLHGMLSATKQRGTEQALQTPAHHAAVHTIAFFDIPQSKKMSEIANTNSAHPPESLLMTAGSDNAIVQWSFHTVDGAAMRIRLRSGHRGACTYATFYGPDLVVSSAGDEDGSLRVTHLFSDRASWELSQGSGSEKAAANMRKNRSELLLAPTQEILTAPIRNHQWSSIVTRHESSAKVGAWAFDTRKLSFLGEPIRTVSQTITTMALSLCGSYVVLGFSSGHVVRMNLQDESILHFVHIEKEIAADSGQDPEAVIGGMRATDDRAVPSCHCGSVGSVIVAFDNDIVVTCGPTKYFTKNSINGNNNNKRKTPAVGNCFLFWSLLSGKLLGWSRSVESPSHLLREVGALTSDNATKSSASTLLCSAGADNALRVYNIPHPDASWYSTLPLEARVASSTADSAETTQLKATTASNLNSRIRERVHVARCFRGHRAKITAIAVNPDTRRHIFSASADGGLAVWDAASASCIGLFNSYSPILSMNFDSDGAFLLTSHAGDRCPQLWSCLLRYGMVSRPIEIDLEKDQADGFESLWNRNATPLVAMLHKEDRDEDEDEDDETEEQKNKNKKNEHADTELFSENKDIALQARRREQERINQIRSIQTRGWSLAAQESFAAAMMRKKNNNTNTETDTASVSMDDWLSMSRLDAIYKKNEPLLPPKKADAPFFLPMTQELRPTFIVQEQNNDAQSVEVEANRTAAQRRTKNAGTSRRGVSTILKEFEKTLSEFSNSNSNSNNKSKSNKNTSTNYYSIINDKVQSLLTELVSAAGGVAALDADILLITSPVSEEDFEGQHQNVRRVLNLLKFCAIAIKLGKAIDFVQAVLATTLKHHGALLGEVCVVEEDEHNNGEDDDANNNDQDDDEFDRLYKQSRHKVADEVRHVIGLVKNAQKEAKNKMDLMCGATTCFASTFANAYG